MSTNCGNCGRTDGLRRGRCGACAQYFRRHGKERTPVVMKPRHGHTSRVGVSREYSAWCSMKSRCANPRQRSYSVYGGRGISICPEWSSSFMRFYADMGPCPRGFSIERIDNDGPYEPGNCRWASRREQDRNTRRNRWLSFNGETLCLADWATRIGLTFAGLKVRLRSGWSVEKALTTPVRPYPRRSRVA